MSDKIDTFFGDFLFSKEWKPEGETFSEKFMSLLKLDSQNLFAQYRMENIVNCLIDIPKISMDIIEAEGLKYTENIHEAGFGAYATQHDVLGTYSLYKSTIFINHKYKNEGDVEYTFIHELAHHFDQRSPENLFDRVKILTNALVNEGSQEDGQIMTIRDELVAVMASHLVGYDFGINPMYQTAYSFRYYRHPKVRPIDLLDRTEACYNKLREAYMGRI